MQRFILAALLILPATVLAGDEAIDFTRPESVVSAVFHAASTGQLEPLAALCDPMNENDGDTRRICSVAAAPEAKQAEFKAYFAAGKLDGEATIEGDRASVPFLFGPDGTRKESMEMVRREGKWYLMSF
jgi:hypothetical protein